MTTRRGRNRTSWIDRSEPLDPIEALHALGRLSRRRFLQLAFAGSAGAAISCDVDPLGGVSIPEFPFTLGVASGDPLSDRVILWTRLAPEPLAGGGMPDVPVSVIWEVSSDESFGLIERAGFAVAHPSLAHSVHVDVNGLEPDRWYFYRFRVGPWVSDTGRTRTMPLPGSAPERLRFAFASCQNYKEGFYTAYGHMAEEDLDLVLHLGDYIYESGEAGPVRNHDGPRLDSLLSYRNRHALYKTDPNLQAAHRNFPWILTWDDHEVANNYAGLLADENQPDSAPPAEEFPMLRARAYRAYYEHTPIRLLPPKTNTLEIFRRFDFGDLASFFMADTRQHRDNQQCLGAPGIDALTIQCAEFDPDGTMLGADQDAWLLAGLAASTRRWNLLAQSVVFSPTPFAFGPLGTFFNFDQWDGYPGARQRILDVVKNQDVPNFVVLSGDIHASGAGSIPATSDLEMTPLEIVGAEFVATGISSNFPESLVSTAEQIVEGLPHIEFFNGRERGYVRCTLGREEAIADFRLVDTTLAPTSPIQTVASFLVEDGVPGAQPL